MLQQASLSRSPGKKVRALQEHTQWRGLFTEGAIQLPNCTLLLHESIEMLYTSAGLAQHHNALGAGIQPVYAQQGLSAAYGLQRSTVPSRPSCLEQPHCPKSSDP